MNNDIYFQRITPDGEINSVQLDPTTILILEEAKRLGIEYELISDTDVIKLYYQGQEQYFRNRVPTSTFSPATKICADKTKTRAFLQRAKISIPKGYSIFPTDSSEAIEQTWNALRKPIVVKSVDETHGKNIFVGVQDFEECLRIVSKIFSSRKTTGSTILLEEMFEGSEYRIVATNQEVIAVIERVPASITGDGIHTIKELIETKNLNPFRNISQEMYPHIHIDEEMEKYLAEQQTNVLEVPENGKRIMLRKVSNVMAGGDSIDRTDEISESVKRLAVQTIRAIPGLSWGGIDFMTKNLHQPQTADSYIIVEINGAPEFDMNIMPMQGKSRNVAKAFLKLMFPTL